MSVRIRPTVVRRHRIVFSRIPTGKIFHAVRFGVSDRLFAQLCDMVPSDTGNRIRRRIPRHVSVVDPESRSCVSK